MEGVKRCIKLFSKQPSMRVSVRRLCFTELFGWTEAPVGLLVFSRKDLGQELLTIEHCCRTLSSGHSMMHVYFTPGLTGTWHRQHLSWLHSRHLVLLSHRVILARWASQEWLASLDPRYRVPSLCLTLVAHHLWIHSMSLHLALPVWARSQLQVSLAH